MTEILGKMKWAGAYKPDVALPHVHDRMDIDFINQLRIEVPGAMITAEGPALRAEAFKAKVKKEREDAAKFEALSKRTLPKNETIFESALPTELSEQPPIDPPVDIEK